MANSAASAMGRLRVEIQDATGNALPGFSLAESDELFGDNIEQTVTWKDSSDVSSLAGHPIRLRFRLQDGDLYSFRFHE